MRVVSQMFYCHSDSDVVIQGTSTHLFIKPRTLVQGVRWLGVAVLQMCGCALVCSDSPGCLGLRDKHHAHQVLGGNGVESLHGDGPQAQPLLTLMMLATSLGYPLLPHALDCKAGAVAQWGIEAEAILRRGLRYTQVDCRGWGGAGWVLQQTASVLGLFMQSAH